MKKTICLMAMLGLLFAFSGNVLASGGVEGNINLLIGQKFVNDDAAFGFEYYEVEDQPQLGMMFDIKPAGFPIAFAFDLLGSEEESQEFLDPDFGYYRATGRTREIDLGIRFYTPPHIIRGYFGGGLALVEGELSLDFYGDEISEEDDEVGFWVNGGFMCTLARHLNLGIDLRYSEAEVELLGEDVDVGGVSLSGFVGFHF